MTQIRILTATSPGNYDRPSIIDVPGLRNIVTVNDTFNSTTGATPDRVVVEDGQITNGQNTFNSASSNFVGALAALLALGTDVRITVVGAGANGDDLRTTVSNVLSNTQLRLGANASTTVNGAEAKYGTNNQAAWNAALQAVTDSGPAWITARAGGYMSSQQINLNSSGSHLIGMKGVYLDCSNVPVSSGARYGVLAVGWVGQSSNNNTPTVYLTADAQAGWMEVQVASTVGLQREDWVLLACDGTRGTLAGGQNGGGGAPAVGTAFTATDTQFLVLPAAGTSSPSAIGILRIENEHIAYSSWATVNIASVNYWQFTVRATPTGRGLWAATLANASSHALNKPVYEQSDAKALRKNQATQDKGEWHRIANIDAGNNVVYFHEPLDDTYLANNQASLREGTGLISDVSLESLTIDMGTKAGNATGLADEDAVRFIFVRDFAIRDVKVISAQSNCIHTICCFNGNISDSDLDTGVCQAGSSTARYAIAVEVGCQWLSISKNVIKRGMGVSMAQLNSGQGWWGCPRFIVVTGNVQENNNLKEFVAHGGYQIEGNGRHVDFVGNTADGVQQGFYIQGSHVTVVGNTIRNWQRAGIQMPDDMFQFSDVQLAHNNIGKRAWGAGWTTLTADLNPADVTITVAQTALYFTGNTTAVNAATRSGTIAVVKLSGGSFTILEIIQWSGSTSTTLQSLARAQMGTVAGTYLHTDATIKIVPFSGLTTTPTPVAMDLRTCIWAEDPLQVTTTLAAAITNGDTTVQLTSVVGLPTSGRMQIEPQPLDGLIGYSAGKGLATNVFFYNGIVGSTLQNVVFGLNGAVVPGTQGITLDSGSGKMHDANIFVATYYPAVANVSVDDNTMVQDYDNYCIYAQGYCPGDENVEITNNKMRAEPPMVWNNTSGTLTTPQFTSFCLRCELPGAVIDNNKMFGYPNGAQITANKCRLNDNVVKCSWQQTSGVAYRLQGSGTRGKDNDCFNTFQGYNLSGGNATNTIVQGGVLDVGGVVTNAIVGALSDTIFRDVDIPNANFSVASASNLSLIPGSRRWTVTGNTTVNTISQLADQTEITLCFTGGPITVNGAAIGGAAGSLILSNGVYKATAGGSLTLVSDGTQLWEKSRMDVA